METLIFALIASYNAHRQQVLVVAEPEEFQPFDLQALRNSPDNKPSRSSSRREAVAALYTEDAVLVNDTGPIYGRDAVEKHYADVFKQVHFSNHIITADQYSPHIIGPAGNEAWTSGEWTTTLKGQNFGPVDAKGNWVEIYHRAGDDWKIRLDIWNVTPSPAAAATPSPTSSK